ncbi:MAG TPA: type II toxin-antitoxin system VapC family toxin [Microthrixaceae bacterium]|nr:type II toxin-antitoxin system VapC family toxin [Microthrixaceae bacterium]HPB45954.1 type II toxin-antitoxin system VapC family toxin [Microthrixaceae bacterium]
MIVVDASVLFEVVADTPRSRDLRTLLAAGEALSAPHLIDAEVLAVIQTHLRRGHLDQTAASQAVDDLRSWPGERWSHRLLMPRAWELRNNVRSYDALYVALAEALDAPLVTLDARLAAAPGPLCRIIVAGQ